MRSMSPFGTSPAPMRGNTATIANDSGYPSTVMSAPRPGPTRAETANCPVFWAPSAFPRPAGAGRFGHRGERESVVGDRHRRGEDEDDPGDDGERGEGDEGEAGRECAGRDGDDADEAHSSSERVRGTADDEAPESTGELSGGDDASGHRRRDALVGDEPDESVRRECELGDDEECGDDVDAPEEGIRPVGIPRRGAPPLCLSRSVSSAPALPRTPVVLGGGRETRGRLGGGGLRTRRTHTIVMSAVTAAANQR